MEVRCLQDIVFERAALEPDAPALWWQGASRTYAMLADRVEVISERLAETLSPGERIAVLAWNCPEFIELIYAAPRAGVILVPLNARLAPAEWMYQLQSAGVSLLVAEPELLGSLQACSGFDSSMPRLALGEQWQNWLEQGRGSRLPDTRPEDPAWILYTSGSTGRPKGAVLSHEGFMAGLQSAAMARPVQSTDRYFYPFPLFHVAAHNVLLQHLYGASVVLARRFEASETLRACRELGVTSMSLAPTMLAMLLDHPDYSPEDLAGLRSIGYGASAMPLTLLQRVLCDSGVGLCQSYGMTELSGSVSFLTEEDHRAALAGREHLLGSVGRPLQTASIRIVDESGSELPLGQAGEIVVRARQQMQGYWADPRATAATLVNGYLHTGDIGRFDEEGYLYIVDRKKDMIISGGENVASREVEEVLRQHPALRDCAIIGVPDEQWGERIMALVVPVADSVPTLQSLQEHCRRFLASYKCPRDMQLLTELPLNAAGKVDKPALRQRYAV